MKDNLPEINFKGRQEKKGGFLGFLRGTGSAGSGGIGAAGASSSASAGIGGLIAGKITTILTVLALGAAGTAYVVNRAPSAADQSGALASVKQGAKQAQEYVPSIQRHEEANRNASSLAMFTETNKGSGLSLQDDPNAAQKKNDTAKDAKTADAAADGENGGGEEGSADPQAMAEGMEQAQLGGGSSLTSSLGGGSGGNRLNFGNKLGQGAGGKASMAQLGTGFQAMPKFQERKGKMLSMKSGARPVFTSGKGGKSNKFSDGNKTWNQARGMLARQQSYTGSNANQARSNQDAAWEGTTGGGDAEEAAGLGDGSAGIVTSPSMDNFRGDTTPDSTRDGSYYVDTNDDGGDISPWAADAAEAAKYIGYATGLGLVAGGIIVLANKAKNIPVYGSAISLILKIIAGIMLAVALAMAGYALYMAQKVMWGCKDYKGQTLLGGIYTVGAGFALAGLGMLSYGLLAGKDNWKTLKQFTATNASWSLLAASMVTGLAAMFSM